MHDCDTLLSRVSLDLDGRLEPAERKQLALELAGCPECRARVQAMRAADAALRKSPLLVPRFDFSATVLQQIAQQQLHDRRLLGVTLLVGGALSLGPSLLVGLGLVLALLAALQPAILQGVIGVFVAGLSALQAFLVTFTTLQDVLGVWILPSLAALVGVVLLVLTLFWAGRISMPPRYLDA